MLKHLHKFDKANRRISDKEMEPLFKVADELANSLSITEDMRSHAIRFFDDEDFNEIYDYIDLTTSSGLEYKVRGLHKKRDAFKYAMPHAKEYVNAGRLTRP